jgi:hypothetical protein
MTKDLSAQFQQALLDSCAKAAQLGVRSPRLEKQIAQRGGVDALRENLRRSRVSDLFDGLSGLGHLELSPEALVVQGKFGPLFTDEEADFCLAVLCEAGYYTL